MVHPDRLAVGIPFAFLREKIAVVTLSRGKFGQRAPGALHAAECDQCIENKCRIAKPKAFVGVRTGINLARRVQHRLRDGKIVELFHLRIASMPKRAPSEPWPRARTRSEQTSGRCFGFSSL